MVGTNVYVLEGFVAGIGLLGFRDWNFTAGFYNFGVLVRVRWLGLVHLI